MVVTHLQDVQRARGRLVGSWEVADIREIAGGSVGREQLAANQTPFAERWMTQLIDGWGG